MDKFNHLSYMFNVRTKNKKYENFVVNAIYNRVGNMELEPITQQYVCNPNDPRKYYLIDLYFPQINYGIEVNEAQHLGEEHTLADKERAEAIKDAIDCTVKVIDIFEKKEKPESAVMRSFEDINNQINLYVDEIRELISQKEKADGKRLQWKSDAQKKKEIWESGVLSISDSVSYANKKEIEILLGVTPDQYRCYRPLSSEYYLWVPGLSVRDHSGKIYSSNNWENYLSEDKTEIVEIDTDNKRQKSGTKNTPKRITFMKMKDKYGKYCCKFIGVFELRVQFVNSNGHLESHYKRIMDKINIVELNIKQNQQSGSKAQCTAEANFTPEELVEIKKHGEDILAKYRNKPTGSLAEFVKKCESSAKLDEHGIRNGKI